ncbi:XRE family transcriptional regulator [Cupriavidus sp. WKF15]|uniref:helix-turn-helix domain-containing protein n=1 Tax=Cupriavidus sp. WKF15 TaxID=3032282 RepID=UPI0023E21B16|nr:XRE family transcriptional regulator [Cupriavidus sp. WKF15]WER50782.1 XRE family transcriptional regulator [Cupriavidus sp. WKF15]
MSYRMKARIERTRAKRTTSKHQRDKVLPETTEPTGDGPRPSGTHPGHYARAARRRQNLTLDELAERTGLSKGHLSRFERGEKSLSIAALIRLAEALHTRVSTLLGESAGTDGLHVVRAADRQVLSSSSSEGGYRYAALSRAQADAPYEAFIVHLNAESSMNKGAYHGGEEMFFVLSGAVEIELEAHTLVLRSGDYAQFPGHIQHRVRGIDPQTSILIVVAGANE